MFIGEYRHTIDQKKRLAIPAKFRKELGGGAVITRGFDNCLYLYSQQEWAQMADKLGHLPLGQVEARVVARAMLAGAMEAEFDQLGRILIPDYLKTYASLKKNIVIAGLYNHLEIWDEERWNDYKAKTEKEVGDLASKLGEFGI